ncbi:MAG: CsgG/HfaB family protein [Candidatus Omnitrophica bacterium]|nr:CsgG/HfaB family protein [Candidatus Omnitrophota bacterium]
MKFLKEKLFLAVIFMGSSLLVSIPLVSAEEHGQEGKDTILIGRIQIQPSVQEMAQAKGYNLQLKRVAESIESQLINTLGASELFLMVERKRKSDIELEQAFAAVATNPGDKNAAQVLKMTGAKYIFLPQIDGFEDIVETQEHAAIGRVSRERKLYLSVVVQIVDATTAEMLPAIASIQIEKRLDAEMVRLGTEMSSEKGLVELSKEMAEKLTQSVVCALRPPTILTVTGQQVLINRGQDAGFKNGDEIEIFATQHIKDAENNRFIKNEALVGKAIIFRSERSNSSANLTGENLGVTGGCIVKPAMNNSQPTGQNVLTPGSSEKPLKWTQ